MSPRGIVNKTLVINIIKPTLLSSDPPLFSVEEGDGLATPVKSKEHPNLRILPFPKKVAGCSGEFKVGIPTPAESAVLTA